MSNIKNIFHNITKMFISKEQKILLGRWETSRKYINIKSTQANFDSCGDKLCGNPDYLIKIINKDKF